ncbi:MAG: hypothetical protein A2842_01515 [Candidatus Wildermuthbacteria bacterium RIFCSPHIGHO2_01_FULL_48_25]|nr:MAG: hypothetical protein A2842_01515 [Candidatus Wildermuthbacteria bacterium RIFCSPHIGHO2_01_FULL_48_25]
MDRNYFIKLVFGTHKVADLLVKEGKQGGQLKTAANSLLSDLLLICEENPVTLEQKKNILPRTLRGIGQVQNILNQVKDGSKVNPQNFAILEQEYKKIPDMLVEFFVSQNLLNSVKEEEGEDTLQKVPETRPGQGVDNLAGPRKLSLRQEKILEFLKGKEKAQVWELQKMLPEPVTKRTLRRDMDDLMHKGRVERQGEWNGVVYKLRQSKEELAN